MTAAIYFLSASTAVGLVTRAWLLDRDDPARRAFMGLGWALAVAWMALALSFLPGGAPLRALWTVAGCLAPAYAWRCVDATFTREGEPSPLGPRLVRLAWGVGLAAGTTQLLLFDPHAETTPPKVVAGTFAAAMVLGVIRRLLRARASADLPAERTRLTWMTSLVVASSGFAFAEWAVRLGQPAVDEGSLPFFDRGLVLQGPVPPVSALLTAAVVYFLYHTLQAHRIVALQELLSRLAVVLAGAGAMLVLYLGTVAWVQIARFPLHAGFLLFVVTAIFLSVYHAIQPPLARAAGRWFNQRGQDLEDAVQLVLRELPARTTGADVAEAIVERLYASGRFQGVGVWLFDGDVDAYRLERQRGLGAVLRVVAPSPFIHGFVQAERWYTPHRLRRQALSSPEARTQLELVDAMHGDLVLPFQADSAILGWFVLRDEVWSDGFSPEERARFLRVAEAGALALSNIASFEALEEAHRLAALGAMSAGLAHEIRNPLAGLKGAAQVLQGDELDDTSREMLQVIVDEANRLDGVVTEFLTFARPIQLRKAPTDPLEVVQHAVSLVRAEGLPESVRLEVVAPDGRLPRLTVDRERLTQVLLNLLHNARDAVGDGGEVLVHVASRDDLAGRPCVEIVVSDDGSGIPEEALPQLFTPFFTTKDTGTGLGLPISRRIVMAHGGELEVRRPPEGGAAFVVRLPLAASAEDAVQGAV